MGERYIVGIYPGDPDKYVYSMISKTPDIAIPMFPTDDEPQLVGGSISHWFHVQVMDKLFSEADAGAIERAWEAFCQYYYEMKGDITNWIHILERTQGVVSYPHEVLEVRIHDQVCRLEGDEVLTPKAFRRWYFFRFRLVLVITLKEWVELTGHWLKMAVEGEVEESVLPGSGCLSEVINYIREREGAMATTKEELEKNPRIPYLLDGTIYLSGKVVQQIVDNDGVSPRRFASLAQHYLIGASKPIRVGKRLERFWAFDPIKVGIEMQRKLDEEVEM